MKKILFLSILLSTVYIFSTNAKEVSRPDPLDERGPLTKMTFIHYKRANAKPDWAGGGKKDSGATKCYSVLSKGASWKNELGENFFINPNNNSGVLEAQVLTSIDSSVGEWNGNANLAIFGQSSTDYTVFYDENNYDNRNTLSFGLYNEPNVIAVTNVWGYFGGPPQTRELVEWDMLLNEEYVWGDANADSSLMDIENIVTHELGHALGLGHPDASCVDETMYAYSSEGETSKRSLNDGDIQGLLELY